MKRPAKIIFGIVFIGTSILCSLYLLPQVSEHYLKSDISEIQNSLLPFTILLSIAFASIIVYEKAEFNKNKWSKIIYLVSIGMMSFFLFGLTSNVVTTVALKTNSISKNELINKHFVINTFTTNEKGDTIPLTIMSENKFEVRGRLSDKTYENDVDGLFINIKDYKKIKQKKEIRITLHKGFLGIPFEPTINE